MYCNNCGSEIADGSKFCSNCGSPLAANVTQNAAANEQEAPAEQKAAPAGTRPLSSSEGEKPSAAADNANIKTDIEKEDMPQRRSFAEFQWNVEDYPDSSSEKTEDINFDWNADPRDIPDAPSRYDNGLSRDPGEIGVSSAKDVGTIAAEVPSAAVEEKPMSASDKIDKFYTFNRKNEEFQQLLNKEYEKARNGNPIESEMTQAEKLAEQRFDSRNENSSMEDFLKREGIVKPYEPKAFESDVLKRIEASEAEKAAKLAEEKARMAAIEEARAAEAEAKRKAAEEAERLAAEAAAKQKAEEEAARLAEIAKQKAIEEAKAEEEARVKALEEAKAKAEEEAKRRIEEEKKLRAEAEAKVKAAEEARLKAEADLKAAQEAAKIRAQQEARATAEAEAKLKARQEREQFEAREAQAKLEAERKKIAEEANQAVAEAEVRKVIEQTVRMRDEEAEKIKAAVAAMRDGIDNIKVDAAKSDVDEARDAARNQIDEMTRARDEYFAGLKSSDNDIADSAAEAQQPASAKQPVAEPEVFDMPEPAAPETSDASAPVTGRATMLSDSDIDHTKVADKEFLRAGSGGDTIVASGKNNAAPENDDDFFNSLEAVETDYEYEDDDKSGDGLKTAAGAAAVGAATAGAFAASTAVAGAAEAGEDAAVGNMARPIDFKDDMTAADFNSGADDLLSQFESVSNMPAAENPDTDNAAATVEDVVLEQAGATADSYVGGDTIHAGSDFRRELQAKENAQAADSTVVMPRSGRFEEAAAANDFDSYGNAEAADYIDRQRAQENRNTAMDTFFGDDTAYDEDLSQLSKKELRKREKEQKRAEKERAKEEAILRKRDDAFDNVMSDDAYEKESSGKGRVILKIVLVLLILILAIEVVGMGIRFIAPQSKAAELIDTQLNKVIHLITGDDSTDYSVIAAEVRTDAIEDKTELIEAQMDNNVNDNIKSIVYSSDLGYDQDTYGEVSDLVLSQPVTQVLWGRDEKNHPVYYDEEVIGTIIAFESSKVELMNEGDTAVLEMISDDTDLYSEIKALANQKTDEDFEKLEIGEIRQAGVNYYVWVRETMGDTATEKVYALTADEEFVMTLTACYTI